MVELRGLVEISGADCIVLSCLSAIRWPCNSYTIGSTSLLDSFQLKLEAFLAVAQENTSESASNWSRRDTKLHGTCWANYSRLRLIYTKIRFLYELSKWANYPQLEDNGVIGEAYNGIVPIKWNIQGANYVESTVHTSDFPA